MRFRLFILTLFAISFIIFLSSCSKSPKDKVITVHEKIYAWFNSDDFVKEMEAIIEKDPYNWQSAYNKKLEEFIISAGFKDFKDFDSIYRKNIEDQEVKEWSKKINEAWSKRYDVINTKMQEVLGKKRQEQMQQQQEQGTPADSTAKQ